MTTAVEALREHRAQESQRKRESVAQAVAEMLTSGGAITVSAVATRAGVSRQFIYSHQDLYQTVQEATRAPRQRQVPRQQPDVELGLRADRNTLMTKVNRQKAVIENQQERINELEQMRRRWLGDQLSSATSVDPEEHAELRLSCDRLVAENARLNRTIIDLRRINEILKSDLTASRQAHAEDMAQYSQKHEVNSDPAQDGAVSPKTTRAFRPDRVTQRS
ncbi:DUF6262 family protein [Nocardioides kongjuensis]|uniref:Uncharacterized protein n=1 Tax=Nocardioides kongjuensis TaxID=349522 RepID=A0A852R7W0_9ACTN|nr:DUF6262 family protein [Nocardioides kongjuensis]NYD30983.1 hypothetical protein [Nocardioides kongjuensis]